MPLVQMSAAESADARAARRLARLLTPMPAFSAHLPESPERGRVEQYIAHRFHEAHGATIHDFMPVLLTMGCHGGLSAASGIRAAAAQALFLEQYLDAAVEQVVAEAARAPVRRDAIAEIGNLVATRGGSSHLLFLVLTAVLNEAGFEWVVFTATPPVRTALARLGLHTERLCDADPGRLTRSDAEEWGRYYAARPQVIAGNVTEAIEVIRRRRRYAGVLAPFREPIVETARVIEQESRRRGTFRLTA